MTNQEIARRRLHNQQITQRRFEKPEEVVRWLGAVQAQDYAAAKWALGVRTVGVRDDEVERACNDGAILRTHVMRPTWHFVAPEDIRWLLALTGPRVNAHSAYRYQQLELDDALFQRSTVLLIQALKGGNQLTRAELIAMFQQAGIAMDDTQRFVYIMMRAELDGLVCSGARRGNQSTYALLDERVPPGKTVGRDEALAELTRRYFTSHGPATIQDFVWWSGLTTADARAGLAMADSQLQHEVVDGQTYWFADISVPIQGESSRVYLLPNYDEYIVGYTDRRAIFDDTHTQHLDARGNILFTHTIVVDGQVVGTWKRELKKDGVLVTLHLFVTVDDAPMSAVTAAAERYGAFLGRSVTVFLQNE